MIPRSAWTAPIINSVMSRRPFQKRQPRPAMIAPVARRIRRIRRCDPGTDVAAAARSRREVMSEEADDEQDHTEPGPTPAAFRVVISGE